MALSTLRTVTRAHIPKTWNPASFSFLKSMRPYWYGTPTAASSNPSAASGLVPSLDPYDHGYSIGQVRDELKKVVGAQKVFSDGAPDRSQLLALLPKSQSELPAKSIKEGLQVAWLRLSDPTVREKYINFMMHVRYGRILEDLDTFAVWTSYMHNKTTDDSSAFHSPLVIVTAMVDQIDMKQSHVDADKDIRMIGFVSWVGKTSMEITMKMEQQKEASSAWTNVLDARFLMVARDPLNQGSAFVAPLRADGPQEEAIVVAGENHKIARQKESKESLLKMSPSQEESVLIHSLFLSTIDLKTNSFRARVKPEHAVWMEETLLKNVLINHPQERNLYNKIFGGYLMRQAFELAWSNAVRYSKFRPVALSVDDIVFQRPVEIGTLLFLSSQVVYTKDSFVQIKVHAEVVKPTENKGETSNIFYFTFGTPQGEAVPVVLPKTYAEYMLFVDGKRHFEAVMGTSA